MQVTYDKSIKLAGVGTVAWTRLGLERYFDSYSIITQRMWDLPSSEKSLNILKLDGPLVKAQTQAIVDSPAFKNMVSQQAPDSKLIPYKPVDPPEWLAFDKLVQTKKKFTKTYENKRIFREYFASLLPFAPYNVRDYKDLNYTEDCYAKVSKGKPVVLQDESLSGGRGTFIVRTFADYTHALTQLHDHSKQQYIVVSKFISNAHELSVQCCVTKHGLCVGPLQRQIVGEPLLCNMGSSLGDKFCGAQIGAVTVPQTLQEEIARIANVIGSRAAQDGYRGIFGVDLLLEGDKVFVLEMNARMTGVTPLLTMLAQDGDIPFFLLHALELGNYDYAITGLGTALLPFNNAGSMLILHARQTGSSVIKSSPASGIYTWEAGKLEYVRPDFRLNKEDFAAGRILLQQWTGVGSTIAAGGRLAVLYMGDMAMDYGGNLTKKAQELINEIYMRIQLD